MSLRITVLFRRGRFVGIIRRQYRERKMYTSHHFHIRMNIKYIKKLLFTLILQFPFNNFFKLPLILFLVITWMSLLNFPKLIHNYNQATLYLHFSFTKTMIFIFFATCFYYNSCFYFLYILSFPLQTIFNVCDMIRIKCLQLW